MPPHTRANPGELEIDPTHSPAGTRPANANSEPQVPRSLADKKRYTAPSISTAAAILHTHGITEISTSAQTAATALQPLASRFAFLLFVCDIVGTGLLAVPVLVASACYRVGDAVALENKTGALATKSHPILCRHHNRDVDWAVAQFPRHRPVKTLFWTAILNGTVAAPLMGVIMTMASSQNVMGKLAIPAYVGWLATGVMLCAFIVVFFTWKKIR